MKNDKLSLFEGYGIELEYMIVGSDNLAVLPIADKLLRAESGDVEDVERGPIAWSNEAVLHLIELKTNGPARTLEDLPKAFTADIQHINGLLAPLGGRLMPTGMHPLMDPRREMNLWPHGHREVYQTFDRIFDCRGHGWANLQSAHLNLPFADDTEFAQLHAAVRLILPLLPALAASSPMAEGKLTGIMDTRLHEYRNNCIRVPSVTGHVIPEGAYSRKEYEMNILARIYQDISTFDPDGILQKEWLNARGAIARFDRHALEIRLLDVQECPLADLSIATAITCVLRALISQRWVALDVQKAWPVHALVPILRETIRNAHEAVIDDEKYLRAFHYTAGTSATAGQLWQHLIDTVMPAGGKQTQPWRDALAVILQQGPLARRIVRALGRDLSRDHIRHVYGELCDCLNSGTMFRV